jgi:hypothetical protein
LSSLELLPAVDSHPQPGAARTKSWKRVEQPGSGKTDGNRCDLAIAKESVD